MPGLFITGTDTGAGKSVISSWLLQQLQIQGHRVAGMKPVASGTEIREGRRWNEDVALLQKASNLSVPEELMNPYLFDLPASPHIAAARQGESVEIELILQRYTQLQSLADWVIVEGVGGWMAPLSEEDNVEALARALKLPVVLVVGMQLGCLNHAMLSVTAIINSGCQLKGWVANIIDPQMQALEENIAYLYQHIPAPCLAVYPHQANDSPSQTTISLNSELLI